MAAQPLRVIGVLGGMGPDATVWLMRRIIAFTHAEDDCDHIPLLVDNNTQVPSRIKAIIEKTGEDPASVLRDMAQKLEQSGAEALVMPCNTAHFYADAVQKSVNIPLLNMLALTAGTVAALPDAVSNQSVRRVGMLASPAVRMTGVYDRVFEKVGVGVQYPDKDERLLTCIKALKSGRHDPSTVTAVNDVIAELEASGADVVVIACSELSLLSDQLSASVPKIDAIDVLARVAVNFSTNGKIA